MNEAAFNLRSNGDVTSCNLGAFSKDGEVRIRLYTFFFLQTNKTHYKANENLE
jgi:hypothetical protein